MLIRTEYGAFKLLFVALSWSD